MDFKKELELIRYKKQQIIICVVSLTFIAGLIWIAISNGINYKKLQHTESHLKSELIKMGLSQSNDPNVFVDRYGNLWTISKQGRGITLKKKL